VSGVYQDQMEIVIRGRSQMINDELNRFVHEKIMGQCWHEAEDYYYKDPDSDFWSGMRKRCKKCHGLPINPDYTQWEHYGKVLEKLHAEDMWNKLAYYHLDKYENQDELDVLLVFDEIMHNPLSGLAAIAEFFRGKK